MGIKVRGFAVQEATEWGYIRLQCTDLVLHANVFLVRKFEYLRERETARYRGGFERCTASYMIHRRIQQLYRAFCFVFVRKPQSKVAS